MLPNPGPRWKKSKNFAHAQWTHLRYFKVVSFCRQDAGSNTSARVIVPPVEDSVSWHDAIRIKRSVCHAYSVLLILIA